VYDEDIDHGREETDVWVSTETDMAISTLVVGIIDGKPNPLFQQKWTGYYFLNQPASVGQDGF
jgi:hypothetical protein